MIGHLKMSMIGASHEERPNGVCQDASDVIKLKNGWAAAAVADGLGSAARSEYGSETAVRSVLGFISENIPEKWDDYKLACLIRAAFSYAAKRIEKLAETKGGVLADYDTTLTALIYNGENVVYGHVGDGGIIGLAPEGDFFLLTKVQKGDACNETYPLRSGADHWAFGKSLRPVCAVALMTDGIFDLACPAKLVRFAPKQPIYINYIRRYMDRNINRAETPQDFAALEKDLCGYYSGKGRKDTDDDKTFAALINTEIMPAVKEASYYELPDLGKIRRDEQMGLYPGLPKKPEPPTAEPAEDVAVKREFVSERKFTPPPEIAAAPAPDPNPAPPPPQPIPANIPPAENISSGKTERLEPPPPASVQNSERDEAMAAAIRRSSVTIVVMSIVIVILALILTASLLLKDKDGDDEEEKSGKSVSRVSETSEKKKEKKTETETKSETEKTTKKKKDKTTETQEKETETSEETDADGALGVRSTDGETSETVSPPYTEQQTENYTGDENWGVQDGNNYNY